MIENIACRAVGRLGGQGINLSALLANAVPQEVLLHRFLCDEYITVGLLLSLLMQAQKVVCRDGTSPDLRQGRLLRFRHQKALYSLLLISFLANLHCFVKTL